MKTTLVIAAGLITLGACATAPTYDESLASGATEVPVNSAEFIGDDGVTHISVNDEWANYYEPGGRKVVAITGKPTKTLSWRVDEEGRFCEEYYSRAGEEVCGADIPRLMTADGVVTEWTEGKPGDFTYRMERGNPRGL